MTRSMVPATTVLLSRRLRRAGLVALAGLVGLAGCGGAADRQVLTEADSGGTLSIETGEQFEVHLVSNASTGYVWRVDTGSASAFVTEVSSRYDEPDTDLVGSPGTQVFVFEASDKGAQVLRLEYVRLFDQPTVPQQVVEFIVRVDGAPWEPTGDEVPATSTVGTSDATPEQE